MFSDDQLLPISALQHLIFCERQCALIHVERLWAENQYTAEGRVMHSKAHSAKAEFVNGVRVARSLWLKSELYGLVGQADVVEFHPDGKVRGKGDGSYLPERPEGCCAQIGPVPFPTSRVTPVEYKRGKPKKDDSDRIQICAQALCLEEMLDVQIESGDLFYGKRKRRTPVEFDSSLRQQTIDTIARLHEIVDQRLTPAVVREPKCEHCSLLNLCLPDAMRFKTGAAAYLDRQLQISGQLDPPSSDSFEFLE